MRSFLKGKIPRFTGSQKDIFLAVGKIAPVGCGFSVCTHICVSYVRWLLIRVSIRVKTGSTLRR